MVKKEESRDFDVFFFFLFGGGEKSLKFIQAEHKTKGVFFLLFFFWSGGAWGLFIAPTRFTRKGCRLKMVLDGVDLDSPKKILTFSFYKGMELKNPTVGSKVMALGS